MFRPSKLSNIFRRRRVGSSRRNMLSGTIPLWFALAAFAMVVIIQNVPLSTEASSKKIADEKSISVATTRVAGSKVAGNSSNHLDPCSNPHAFPSGPGNGRGCIDINWMSGEDLFRKPLPGSNGRSCASPYFHDNSAKTLEEAVNVYNDHLLSRFPTLTINDDPPPDDPGLGGVDAMSEKQMQDLLSFLRRL